MMYFFRFVFVYKISFALKLLYIIIVVSFFSCIDPFEVETNESDLKLTVNGLISTGKGPHTIRITLSGKYADVSEGRITSVNNANVYLRDDLGNVIFLHEYIQDSITFFNSSPPPSTPTFGVVILPPGWVTIAVNRPTGIYQTPPWFCLDYGTSYTLHIVLSNGIEYTSLPQTVKPVTLLKDIKYRSVRNATSNRLIDNVNVQLFANLEDPESTEDYYLWTLSNAVYPYITNPELVGKDCCDRCFRHDDNNINNTFEISTDRFYNGLNVELPICRIQDDGWRFKDKLRVNINQYSISEEGFRFLSLIKQQKQLSGSIFDAPPANIRGNLIRVDQPEEQVLGFFFISDVFTKEIYIIGNELDFRKQPQGLFPDDCREAKGFSTRLTTTPPVDWVYN